VITHSSRRAAFVAVLALLALLTWQAPAQAHAALVKSTPAAGTVVPDPPTEVVLTFSEPISPVNDKIRVLGPDGDRADTGKPEANGTVLTIKLKENLARGTYLVSFRIISADSHPVPGGFTFSFGEPSATPVEVPQEESDTAVTTLIGVAKYLGYLGILLIAGTVLVLTLLWPSRLERAGPRKVMWAGFGLVTLATLLGIYLQGPYTSGTGLFEVDGAMFSDVMSSRYGVALLVRLGVLAVAAIMLRPLINGTSGLADRVLVLILAGIGVLTWPLAGHPAGSPVPAVSVISDALHLAGASVWLGGLVMLFAFLLRQADERELGAILPIWSRWAGLAVSTVILAGVVSALIEIGTVTALFNTTYGRLILVKVGLVALLVGAAALARRHVQRGEAPKVRRVIAIELTLAMAVLGVTAALTQTTPARTAEAIANTPVQQTVSSTMDSSLFRLQADFEPAKRGNNLVHLYAYDKFGQPLTVVEWKVTAALPSAGLEPVEVPTLKITENHVTGSISLPSAGEWQFRFTLRTTEIDQDTVTATVTIK
jgi:copper transport protein